jgi:hypothetical protein
VIGIGDFSESSKSDRQLFVYIANRPDLIEYQIRKELHPLKEAELKYIVD